MVSEKFGVRLHRLWKMVLDRSGDAGVQPLPLRAHESRIGSVLDERMLEAVGRLGRRAAPEHQS
jgi:hypothetical protein